MSFLNYDNRNESNDLEMKQKKKKTSDDNFRKYELVLQIRFRIPLNPAKLKVDHFIDSGFFVIRHDICKFFTLFGIKRNETDGL